MRGSLQAYSNGQWVLTYHCRKVVAYRMSSFFVNCFADRGCQTRLWHLIATPGVNYERLLLGLTGRCLTSELGSDLHSNQPKNYVQICLIEVE